MLQCIYKLGNTNDSNGSLEVAEDTLNWSDCKQMIDLATMHSENFKYGVVMQTIRVIYPQMAYSLLY